MAPRPPLDSETGRMALGVFEPDTRQAIRSIYAVLEGLYREWLDHPGRDPEVARRYLTPPVVDGLLGSAAQLTAGRDADPALRRLLHDVRGGALSALLGLASILDDVPAPEARAQGHWQSVIWLARDHAKVMRLSVPDLDPEQRRLDEAERLHPVDDLVRKWDGARYGAPGAQVRLTVDSSLRGALAARCLEAATLDRISYNLLNNAARFSAGPEVAILMDEPRRGLGRITVANLVEADQVAWLEEARVRHPHALFQSGVTRGGQGEGLASCAELVASAFAIPVPDALQRHVVGTRVAGGTFLAWFVWPVATGSVATGPLATG